MVMIILIIVFGLVTVVFVGGVFGGLAILLWELLKNVFKRRHPSVINHVPEEKGVWPPPPKDIDGTHLR